MCLTINATSSALTLTATVGLEEGAGAGLEVIEPSAAPSAEGSLLLLGASSVEETLLVDSMEERALWRLRSSALVGRGGGDSRSDIFLSGWRGGVNCLLEKVRIWLWGGSLEFGGCGVVDLPPLWGNGTT